MKDLTLERESFEVKINGRTDTNRLEFRLNRVNDEYQVEVEIEKIAKGLIGSFSERADLGLVKAGQLYGLAGRLIAEKRYKIEEQESNLTFTLINSFGIAWKDYYNQKRLERIA